MRLKFTLFTAIAVFTMSTMFAQKATKADENYSPLSALSSGNSSTAKQVEATLTASNGYLAGATMDLNFVMNLSNTDFEYGDAVTMTFPAGFTINSVSNDDVFGPSFDDPDGPNGDPEPFNGITDQTISWGDDDNAYGGITPGNDYAFAVNVTVDGGLTGEQTIDFTVSGDGFGDNPGDAAGDVTISEVSVNVPLDFELPAESYPVGVFGINFAGVVPNPDMDGNMSDQVFQITTAPGVAFGGAFIDLNEPIDFQESPLFTMDVWSPVEQSPILLKIETADPNIFFEQPINVGTPGQWNTLTFDFREAIGNSQTFPDFPDVPAEDYIRVVILPSFAAAGPGDETYYFDNVQSQPFPTIFEIVEASEVHETLEFALIASGADVALDDLDSDATLFAPTDDAFAEIQSIVDELVMDPEGALVNVLAHHIIVGSVFSGDLSDDLEVQTAQGENITVNIDGSDVTITSSSGNVANLVVDAFDIQASNGVVHVIDAVLVPGLCTSFDGGPYTNFGAAPVAVDGICPFNVITGFQSWASEGYVITDFVEGNTYTFGISGGAIGAWDPEFIVVDEATNEVVASETEGNSITWTSPASGTYICIIQEEGFCGGQSDNLQTDGGFPYITCESSQTITDIVVASDVHTTLETAVITAGLDGVLAGEGPFTVFAPTDAAFEALPDGLLDDILADVAGLLTPILQHHVVPAIAYSSDLSDGQVISTLNEDVTVGIDAGVVSITASFGGTTATVTTADIIASNGVVHVVDAVLTPSVLSVDNLNSVESLNVYPNPTNNQFSVDINLNTTERVSIDIVNVLGQVVKSQDLGVRSMGMNREYINVSDLNNGMYFMNITVGDDQGTVKVQIAK